jgi:hypothetical protein
MAILYFYSIYLDIIRSKIAASLDVEFIKPPSVYFGVLEGITDELSWH